MPDAATVDLEAAYAASGIGPVLEQRDRGLVGLRPVTRDDLVGQYIGHTAPKTKEILKKAMRGVPFIDEAYSLCRPENEHDYLQEPIGILPQVMENRRADLVVVPAGDADRMERVFASDPGFRSRIAHHIVSPDHEGDELMAIADTMLARPSYRFSPAARDAFARYIEARMRQPHLANARAVRNAPDRARLRQAVRPFETRGRSLTAEDLMTIEPEDILASRVLAEPVA